MKRLWLALWDWHKWQWQWQVISAQQQDQVGGIGME